MGTPLSAPPSTLSGRDPAPATPASTAGHDGRRVTDLWWWVAATISVLACAYLHWEVARSASAPRTPWDEVHPLQTARMIAGQTDVTQLSGSGYFPGWAILLAPVWWFTDDAETAYHAAVLLGNVLALMTIVPLAAIARRMGVGTAQATTVAAVAMSLPGRTVLADYALSEQVVLFFLAWSVLAMMALWARPTWLRATAFSVAVSATYLMHSRELALVVTAGVWLAMLAVRHWRVAALGLSLLALLTIAVRRYATATLDATLLGSAGGKEELLARAMESGSPSLLLRVLLNQSWAQVVGTAGLAALGAVILIAWTAHELRRWQIGPGVFLFGTCLSALLLSAVWWTRPDFLWAHEGYLRTDVWIYTRYVDHVASLLVLVALVVLLRGIGRGPLLAALALFATISGAVVFWVAQDVPLWGAFDGPANSAAMLSWSELFPNDPYPLPQQPTFTNENRFWVWASLFGTAALGVMLLLRSRPRVLIVLLLLAAFILSLEANPSQKRDAPRRLESAVEQIEATTGRTIDIDMDYSCRGPALTRYQVLNWLGYWMSPRDVDIADPPSGTPFDSAYVVSCADWPQAEELGARQVADSEYYSYALWVLPGQEQDALEEAGQLVT